MIQTPAHTRQTVLDVRFWVPKKLFSLRISHPDGFSFKPGQFARLGLPSQPGSDPDLWRAFSMVNDQHADYLEFYAIVVPEGQFSPRMAQLQPGDNIYVNKTVFGFLTIEQFPQGGTLWLLATGTGLSAYLSILRDPQTWERFDHVILCHGTRYVNEFAYQAQIQAIQNRHGLRFVYLPIATRETHGDYPTERLTTLIETGRLAELAGHPIDPEQARFMLCGNPDMLVEARKLLSGLGFAAGRRGNVGNLAVEKYW